MARDALQRHVTELEDFSTQSIVDKLAPALMWAGPFYYRYHKRGGKKMAFLIMATMKGYRVLDVKSGTSKKGTAWRSVSLFRDGVTAEVSTSDASLFGAVDALHEMDVINVDVRAVAGKERSYVVMASAPVVVEYAGV